MKPHMLAVVALLSPMLASAAPQFDDTFAPSCSADADLDRLADCVEYATGQFRGAQQTGTYPNIADSDVDGLDDGDEVLGTRNGLNLPAFGVSPVHKDILIEFDWFDDAIDAPTHSHRPNDLVAFGLRNVFANAPVYNLDGTRGINLIADYGQGGATIGGNVVNGYSANLPGYFDATYAAIKSANFASNRNGYFHYSLMVHRYAGNSNSSGFATIPGSDMIVSLHRYYANNNYVVSTIVHELGHNLGLHHGGNVACNGKPNYNSVMNYRFQFHGIDLGPEDPTYGCDARGDSPGLVALSTGTRPPLNESSLDERAGVCGGVFKAIDWNLNGIIQTGISQNINDPNGNDCGPALSILSDHNDWANLLLTGVTPAAKSISQVSPQCPAPPN